VEEREDLVGLQRLISADPAKALSEHCLNLDGVLSVGRSKFNV
jgi:hypothetical protein